MDEIGRAKDLEREARVRLVVRPVSEELVADLQDERVGEVAVVNRVGERTGGLGDDHSCLDSHSATNSATSCQPGCATIQWLRPGNSRKSVWAFDLPYLAWLLRLMAAGTIRSAPPAIMSKGARVSLRKFTFAGPPGRSQASASCQKILPVSGVT